MGRFLLLGNYFQPIIEGVKYSQIIIKTRIDLGF